MRLRLRDGLLQGSPGSDQSDRHDQQSAGGRDSDLSPWSPTGEIVRYVLEGPGYTLNELKAVQDWVLERQLKTVPA